MIELSVRRNIVYMNRNQKDAPLFINQYLVKYEELIVPDYSGYSRSKKFRKVKERRNLYTVCGNYIVFSRGILELIPSETYTVTHQVKELLKQPEVSFDEIKHALSSFDLRDDQILAVNKGLYAKRGVIQLPTASGKSAIITAILKFLYQANPETMNAIVLAPTLSTVRNIYQSITDNGLHSSIFGHPNKSLTPPVTTSLVKSLISSYDTDLSKINVAIYDECLPSNALILLPSGDHKSISEIYEDDSITEVLSYDVSEEKYVIKSIVHKYKTEYNDKFWKVYYKNPVSGKLEGVSLTPNHKVYTKNRGYVQASDLTEDDLIKIDFVFARNWTTLTKSTYIKVQRVSANIGSVAKFKYNLEIEDTHCYFANNVLVSNCHHLSCDTWNTLNSLLPNVEYSIGFSALSIDKSEIYLSDISQMSYKSSLIVGSSGRVLMHMDPSYYIQKGIIALPVVFRISNRVELPPGVEEQDWRKVVKAGLQSTPRTNDVSRLAELFLKYNRKTLILVHEKDYSFFLGRFIVQRGLCKFGISFGSGEGYVYDAEGPILKQDVRYRAEDSLKVLDMLSTGEIDLLIATSHVDEGVDISGLDACILACGGYNDRRLIQRVGRVLRKSKNGNYAYIIDFTDKNSRVLSKHSNFRLKMYKESIGVPLENIYDNISLDNVEVKLKELENL